MQIEFLKEHTTKEGRHYTKGQLTELPDAEAQDLIRQGTAKESRGGAASGSQSQQTKE